MVTTTRKKLVLGITQSNFGGAQRHVYDLALGFRDEFEVMVVYGGGGVLAEKLAEAGIRCVSIASMSRHVSIVSELKSFWSLVQLLRHERPDIFHVHSSKMGGLGALAGRIVGVSRIIFTSHGWEFNAPRPWWQRQIIYLFSVVIVLLSHGTIAVSEALKRDIRFSPARRKITVVHAGSSLIAFLDRAHARRRLMAKDATLREGTWIVSLSELHPVKGLSYAIEAIARLVQKFPNLQYVVMGEGSERAKLERLIANKKLEAHVHLLGFVEGAPNYLHGFDLFLMPSLSEALSYSLLEAGLASLPVVASSVGGIPELVTDKKDGMLVPPCNPGAIAQAIETLLTDQPRAGRLGQKLQERVIADFNSDRMVRETKAVYDA